MFNQSVINHSFNSWKVQYTNTHITYTVTNQKVTTRYEVIHRIHRSRQRKDTDGISNTEINCFIGYPLFYRLFYTLITRHAKKWLLVCWYSQVYKSCKHGHE